ncbi:MULTISPECIES: YigZ family protein [Myxococcus]|uniref:YigZ family protein n=1 Tax=Myxococcus TaxID=32 RepID=UPI00112B766C|nr:MULTISPECIES: YigZ family protein [Myxococcus]QDE96794.1 YigZ family protein [Myxococcus xanthus]QDF04322.1 YigZ family protein [Myxococcus xanthus]WAM29252.1 YigZ family protein [Myxococcus sp. NMCA1]
MDEKRYPIPAGLHRVEQDIQKSRFITTAAHTPTVEEAKAFIARVREEFADATHNCWAFVVGPPGSTAQVGMSDDGEPHGTAGRPMLTALLHGGVGDVAMVVTRYFGGTLLGKGGLVRAYTAGVQQALESLPTTERVRKTRLAVEVEYTHVDGLRRLLPSYEVQVLAEEYSATVGYRLELPVTQVEPLRTALNDLTLGQVLVEPLDSDD